MPPARSASPQTLAVLGALLDDPATWHHGYELSRRTGLASGTLYPILIRLADQGRLDQRWEPPVRPGRPPRHAYRLTPDGLAWARTAIAAQPGKKSRPLTRPNLANPELT